MWSTGWSRGHFMVGVAWPLIRMLKRQRENTGTQRGGCFSSSACHPERESRPRHRGKCFLLHDWEPEDKGSLSNLLFTVSVPPWQSLLIIVKSDKWIDSTYALDGGSFGNGDRLIIKHYLHLLTEAGFYLSSIVHLGFSANDDF